MTPKPPLHLTTPTERVWRVGRTPGPWNWPDWSFADAATGTFGGRWDSPHPGAYRTTYAASQPRGALVEVLARFRPDPAVVDGMGGVDVDDVDAALYPSIPAGVVPDDWFTVRLITSAHLAGRYVDIAHSANVAALWGRFAGEATGSGGLADFDVSALQNAAARPLTQAISAHLYSLTEGQWEPSIDGIRFLSRFGGDLELWTVFEQPTDTSRSELLSEIAVGPLTPTHPEVQAVFQLLNLEADE